MASKILILGGTSEARQLVTALLDGGRHTVILSLAGALGDGTEAAFRRRLNAANEKRLIIRVGGFGGVDGLVDYLKGASIDLVIDATHPYAAQMSRNAVEAVKRCECQIVRFERQQWDQEGDQNWTMAEDLSDAAHLIPEGSRVLLAVGRQSALPFAQRSDCFFLLRSIASADKESLSANFAYLKAMPGKSVQEEIQLLQEEKISCLVTKNSGAKRSFHKVQAADALGLDVVMIKRPSLPECRTFNDLAAIIDWLLR